jgi:DNA-binding SARP family transcriptional activator
MILLVNAAFRQRASRNYGGLMINVRVLSPFELTCNDQPVSLQLMQITIILALWCARGPVERDNLIRKIWPVPAPGAWDTLRRHLSRIRAALATVRGDLDMLILEPTGPVRTFQIMNVASSDAGEFLHYANDGAKFLRDGQFHMASDLLHNALGMWGPIPETGPAPLTCVAERGFAYGAITELRHAFKIAVLDCMKADISIGRHQQAVTELTKLDRWYPRQTDIAELLAIASYRCHSIVEASRILQGPIRTASKQGVDTRRLRVLQEDLLNEAFPRRGPLPEEFI